MNSSAPARPHQRSDTPRSRGRALGVEIGLRVLEDLTFGALHARLLPNEELGASAGVDHGFCLFPSEGRAVLGSFTETAPDPVGSL